MADIDGVVIIPQNIVEDIITRSEKLINTENLVRKAIKEGMDPQEAYLKFVNGSFDSICLVTPVDSRIYRDKNGFLKPFNESLENKSMWRRQEVTQGFKMYHGEMFKLPIIHNQKFLGKNIGYIAMSSLCSFDIDDSSDLDYLNMRLKTDMYEKFIH